MTDYRRTYYKYCIVPLCTNTTSTASEKVFFSVPKDSTVRKIWANAINRDDKLNPKLSSTSSLWCCEDHFSLRDDMDNYYQWKLTKNVRRFKLKPGIVPHLFDCQKNQVPSPIKIKRGKQRKCLSSIKKTVLGTESQNVAEAPIVLKQEAVDSSDEPPRLVNEKIDSAGELVPSLSFANPHPPNTGEAPTTRVSNKPTKKRKGNVVEQNADDAAPIETQAKSCRRAKRSVSSKENSKPHPLIGTSKSTENLLDSGNESQNVAETSIVIKQEPVESIDEPPQIVIGKILCGEELASSSIGSTTSSNPSAFSNTPPFPKNASPIANPDSTKVDGTSAIHVLQKPAQKRKKLDADDATPNVTQAKCPRTKRSMPSKGNIKLHQPVVGTSTKSTGRSPNTTKAKLFMPSKENRKSHPPAGSPKKFGSSTSPTKNGENATREMLQFLVDRYENNPQFGSRTSERPGDLFDVFSDFIADKLREMDWDDCSYALRTILDVVFKTGQVKREKEVDNDISSPSSLSNS